MNSIFSFFIVLNGKVSIYIDTEGKIEENWQEEEEQIRKDSLTKKKLDRSRFGKFIAPLGKRTIPAGVRLEFSEKHFFLIIRRQELP